MSELKQRKGEMELMKIASLVENQMKFYNVKGNKNTNIKQMDVSIDIFKDINDMKKNSF